MTINPAYRVTRSLVWFPTLDDIKSGAYLQFVPLRQSLLVRHILWLPRKCQLACVTPDREVRTPQSTTTPREPRRIWPADWPAVIVEIKTIDPRDVPPPPDPPATLLDLFI